MAKLTAEMLAAVQAAIRRYIDGEHDGVELAAAKAIGVNQSTLNRVMRGEQQPGLTLLLRLRAKSGESLDRILGLEPPHRDAHAIAKEVAAILAAKSRPSDEEPPSRTGEYMMR